MARKPTPEEQAERALDDYRAALAAKAKDGKLTKAQIEELKLIRQGGGGKTWVSNQTELAKELRTSRNTIKVWIKKKGAPECRQDGAYFVPAWKAFFRPSQGKVAGQGKMPENGQGDLGVDDEPGSLRDRLRNQIAQIEVKDKLFDLETKQKLWLRKSEISDAIRQCNEKVLAEMRRRFCQIAPSEYHAVSGDPTECKKINERHLNDVLKLLHAGQW